MLIRKLTEDDLPAAMRLSRQAGWNQIRSDWQRLLDLNPENCFAGIVDDELVATATLVTYDDDVGWIGMVLVDENHRRRGFGMEIFEQALETAIDRGISRIGLDATDAGRKVYQQVGFHDVAPIERWGGTLSISGTETERYSVTRDPELAEIISVDRRACDVDRSALLERLIGEEGTSALLVSDEGSGKTSGYAVLRPGREYAQIGPIIAMNGDEVAALVEAAADLTDAAGAIVDVLAGQQTKATLRTAGLERQRHLTRMTYGEPARTLNGDVVVAAAGFEFG